MREYPERYVVLRRGADDVTKMLADIVGPDWVHKCPTCIPLRYFTSDMACQEVLDRRVTSNVFLHLQFNGVLYKLKLTYNDIAEVSHDQYRELMVAIHSNITGARKTKTAHWNEYDRPQTSYDPHTFAMKTITSSDCSGSLSSISMSVATGVGMAAGAQPKDNKKWTVTVPNEEVTLNESLIKRKPFKL